MSPVLVLTLAFSGFFIQSHIFTNKEMLIFNAFKDRSTYRCGKIFRILNPTSITCEITNSNESANHNILLVGNSHADSIKSSFANVAGAMNSSLYFLVPNNPLIGNSNLKVKHIIDEALKYNIKSIILHYSPNSIELSKIRKIVDQANKNNIHVGIIMPVPTWNEHIPQVLWENFKYNKKLPKQTLDDYEQKNKELYSFLKSIKEDNFAIYPVSSYLCSSECSFVNNTGRPLYFDGGHLTLTGGDKLYGLFESIVIDGQTFNP
jgi:hypothetical protein